MPNHEGLAPHDVIVEVKSAAVGWVDLLMTSSQYQHMPPLPYTPGLECSGVVIWKGSDVDDALAVVGDKVFVAGPRSPGAYQQYGGFTSYAVAPKNVLRKIPEGFFI